MSLESLGPKLKVLLHYPPTQIIILKMLALSKFSYKVFYKDIWSKTNSLPTKSLK